LPYVAPPRPVAPPQPQAPPPQAQQQVSAPSQAERPLVAAPFVPTANPLASDQPAVDAPSDPAAEAPVDGPMWPCPTCGATVPMSLDFCNSCGAGFLAAARHGHSLQVPFFGDIGKLTSGQRLTIGVITTLALILVFVIVATIGGKLL
jgi:hypothetical protein